MVGIALMVMRWYDGSAFRCSLWEKEACSTTLHISSSVLARDNIQGATHVRREEDLRRRRRVELSRVERKADEVRSSEARNRPMSSNPHLPKLVRETRDRLLRLAVRGDGRDSLPLVRRGGTLLLGCAKVLVLLRSSRVEEGLLGGGVGGGEEVRGGAEGDGGGVAVSGDGRAITCDVGGRVGSVLPSTASSWWWTWGERAGTAVGGGREDAVTWRWSRCAVGAVGAVWVEGREGSEGRPAVASHGASDGGTTGSTRVEGCRGEGVGRRSDGAGDGSTGGVAGGGGSTDGGLGGAREVELRSASRGFWRERNNGEVSADAQIETAASGGAITRHSVLPYIPCATFPSSSPSSSRRATRLGHAQAPSCRGNVCSAVAPSPRAQSSGALDPFPGVRPSMWSYCLGDASAAPKAAPPVPRPRGRTSAKPRAPALSRHPNDGVRSQVMISFPNWPREWMRRCGRGADRGGIGGCDVTVLSGCVFCYLPMKACRPAVESLQRVGQSTARVGVKLGGCLPFCPPSDRERRRRNSLPTHRARTTLLRLKRSGREKGHSERGQQRSTPRHVEQHEPARSPFTAKEHSTFTG